MTRQYLYLGACSEIILARPYGKPLVGYIETNSPANIALHDKARELANENYLDDFAAELNADYFGNTLEFKLEWAHNFSAFSGKARGKLNRPYGAVVKDGLIRISHTIAQHAYTDTEDVVEYILMHEMAHMLEMNHHYIFWLIVARNPNAVNGHHLFFGQDFPIDLTPLPRRKIYIDPRSKGTRLASTGYPEGETIKILQKERE